jgi:hypothetical protein
MGITSYQVLWQKTLDKTQGLFILCYQILIVYFNLAPFLL